MKKVLLGLLCLALVISSCEIPQSITIKGKPGLSISIENIFGHSGNKLEDHLDISGIKKMMGGDKSDVTVYDYEVRGFYDNIQSYLIHYPIAKMELDLSEYVSNAMSNNSSSSSAEIPESVSNYGGTFPDDGLFLSGTGVAQLTEGDPLFTVSFADMAKMVVEVNGTFGLEFSNYSTAFAENVYIKMPAFGLNDYKKGTVTGDKLRFVDDGKTKFIPQDDLKNDGSLEIYVKVMGSCSGTITPELVFDWTTATIDTSSNDNLKGEYTIDNSLGDFLGGNSAFKEVQGYIYANTGGLDDVYMTLDIKDGDNLCGGELTSRPKLSFSDSDLVTELPEPSLETPFGTSYIDFSSLLNASSASTLEYDVKIPKVTIYNNETYTSETISFDLVIVFPLALTVSTQLGVDSSVFIDADKYVKLDMGGVFDFNSGDDSDLFGRTSDDDLLDITYLKITLEDFKNDIINVDVGLLLTAPYPEGSHKPDFCAYIPLANDGTLEIKDIRELNPFIPSFRIIIKKDQLSPEIFADYATFEVRRLRPNPKFDFSLKISANVNIDHTISLD